MTIGSPNALSCTHLRMCLRADKPFCRIAARDRGVNASGRLTTGLVEGPFDGEARSLFAAEARKEPLRTRPGSVLDKLALADEDGAIAPAVYGVDGVYRLRLSLAGAPGDVSPATLYLTGGRAARVRVCVRLRVRYRHSVAASRRPAGAGCEGRHCGDPATAACVHYGGREDRPVPACGEALEVSDTHTHPRTVRVWPCAPSTRLASDDRDLIVIPV